MNNFNNLFYDGKRKKKDFDFGFVNEELRYIKKVYFFLSR